MKRVELLQKGTLLWVQDSYGCLKMITVDDLYWDDTEDEEGWNVVYNGNSYWIECCFELECFISQN